MKKLFVGVLAIASMVACMNEETVRVQDPAAIGFEANWVENATRANEAVDPSTTTTSLEGFDVWGFMDSPAGKVFEGEDVTGSQGNFSYVNTQYWIPGHDYYFAALAPMNSANWNLNTEAANIYGAGIVDFHNVDGTEDLLYAAKMLSTKGLKAGEAPENGVVKLQFSHLLSKVKFTFTNGFDNENAKIDVKKVRMEVPAFASINLAVENWWDNNDWTLAEGKTTLEFGDACANTGIRVKQETANERLTIPADATQKYTVTFDVVFYQGAVVAYKGTKTVTIENVALEMGKAYNFKAELNASNIMADGTELLPIVFDVEEVKDWVTAETPDVNVQEAELRAALLLGGEVTLTEDLVITEPLVVGAGVSSVINLNDFDIVAESTDAIVVEGGNLTINGNGDVKAATDDKSSANAIWVKYGNVVINGGNYYVGADNAFRNDCIYLGAASLKAEAANYKSTITINGGTFEAKAQEYDQYWVLNVQDQFYAAGSDIVVKGGSYKNFNPANNKSEGANTNFVAPGYYSTKIGDYYVVSDTQVVATAEEFAEALKADAETISVKLAGDLDVAISSLGTITGGSGEYKLGGENTKNITIDLNGKKLNITTTYWSAIGAKNDNAVFTIKNGTMTSSQPTGTWNSYDLTFSNCDYVIEDVDFLKAIAFDNAGKSVSLKNVTITESHDYYAMWITAEGQNVAIDGLTVESAGRGIKIDEQYVGTPAKVTLTVKNSKFTTANKAAILVKSVAGAEINVENINIANVAKDTEFAVWVDEDSAAYADLVVVNGALVKVEGAKDTVASSATELAEAVQNGAKNVYLENGTYTLASYPAGLKLVGCGDNVVLDATGKKYGVNGNVAIENVKLLFSNANYTGFQHTNVESYKNCTIVGQPFLYGNDVTFEDCTFEQASADAYNVWTYGAKNVKFVDCVFNCAGKSVLIYTEKSDGQKTLFEGCTLNASAPVEGKAAIEIDSSLIKGVFDITFNDTTATGFANGNVSGNSLWNNKKGDKATITVDGVKVL